MYKLVIYLAGSQFINGFQAGCYMFEFRTLDGAKEARSFFESIDKKYLRTCIIDDRILDNLK